MVKCNTASTIDSLKRLRMSTSRLQKLEALCCTPQRTNPFFRHLPLEIRHIVYDDLGLPPYSCGNAQAYMGMLLSCRQGKEELEAYAQHSQRVLIERVKKNPSEPIYIEELIPVDPGVSNARLESLAAFNAELKPHGTTDDVDWMREVLVMNKIGKSEEQDSAGAELTRNDLMKLWGDFPLGVRVQEIQLDVFPVDPSGDFLEDFTDSVVASAYIVAFQAYLFLIENAPDGVKAARTTITWNYRDKPFDFVFWIDQLLPRVVDHVRNVFPDRVLGFDRLGQYARNPLLFEEDHGKDWKNNVFVLGWAEKDWYAAIAGPDELA